MRDVKAGEMRQVASTLARWFLANARDLPWRRTLDPYAIWVSEIMLQQTQVRTVIPYWERWMRQLPDIAALARAQESTVLKLWEGLGYYSRARNLWKSARVVLDGHEGVFPRDVVAIRSLPGIGRYTGGAIASIAFDLPEPILDGNVVRVLSRVFAVAGNPKDKLVNEELWRLAAEAVGAMKPDGFAEDVAPMRFAGWRSVLNQALMELGATVCLPRSPDCERCPLNSQCRARLTDRVAAFPELPPRAASTVREFHTFVLRRRTRYLIRQRPPGEVNAGFWEFPGIELADAGEKPESSCTRLLGFGIGDLKPLADLRHSITRYRYHQQVLAGEWPARRKWSGSGEWVPLDELRRRPFYSPQLRLLQLLD